MDKNWNVSAGHGFRARLLSPDTLMIMVDVHTVVLYHGLSLCYLHIFENLNDLYYPLVD